MSSLDSMPEYVCVSLTSHSLSLSKTTTLNHEIKGTTNDNIEWTDEQITHGNLKVSIFHDSETSTGQLFITFLPDDTRFRRSKHLARQVDGLTFSRSEANDWTFLDERRLSWQAHTMSQSVSRSFIDCVKVWRRHTWHEAAHFGDSQSLD